MLVHYVYISINLQIGADLVGDTELRHDLVDVDSSKDVDNGLSADVVAFNVQQFQRLVVVKSGCQRLIKQSILLSA